MADGDFIEETWAALSARGRGGSATSSLRESSASFRSQGRGSPPELGNSGHGPRAAWCSVATRAFEFEFEFGVRFRAQETTAGGALLGGDTPDTGTGEWGRRRNVRAGRWGRLMGKALDLYIDN